MGQPRERAAAELEVVGVSATCAYGNAQGVLLVNWRREIVIDDIRTVVAYRDQMLKRTFLGAIHIAEDGLPLPDQHSRQAARVGMEARAKIRAPVALVILGTGFGASAIRSLGTAVFSLRSGLSTRILATPADAAAWLGEQVTGATLDAAALTRACEALRAVAAP